MIIIMSDPYGLKKPIATSNPKVGGSYQPVNRQQLHIRQIVPLVHPVVYPVVHPVVHHIHVYHPHIHYQQVHQQVHHPIYGIGIIVNRVMVFPGGIRIPL